MSTTEHNSQFIASASKHSAPHSPRLRGALPRVVSLEGALRLAVAAVQVFSALGAAAIATVNPPGLSDVPLVGAPLASLLPQPEVASAATGDISGTVFRDFNSNGVKDSNETFGVQFVSVKAFNAAGAQVGATATTCLLYTSRCV